MNPLKSIATLPLLLVLLSCQTNSSGLTTEAEDSIRRGAAFFHDTVATHGGYLWRYSEELSDRAGEGSATASQIWVQPPGTPSVGFAFLRAYQVTGDKTYLDYALDAGKALAWGQLASGGWGYRIDFDPEADDRYYYRREAEAGKIQGKRETNTSTFDDNNTQVAVRFLMILDRLTGDPEIHESALAGLDLLKKSQFPNGAWPQRYPLNPEGYSHWYTFNDNCINDCVQVFLDAYAVYGKAEYRDIALKGGDFFIASQMPPPQGGWAQQYDYDMKPAWARKYEPPGINSRVTSYNIRTLVQLYLETGEDRFLEPIPAAIDWLEASRIGPDLWARFYEEGSNRPLYMTSDYKLVYTDFDLPTHYSFQRRFDVPEAIDLYYRIKLEGRDKYLERKSTELSDIAARTKAWALENHVKGILSRQDDSGRWVSDGRITSRTFIASLLTLAEYIETIKGGPKIKDIPVELVDVPLDLLTRTWKTTASSGE